MWKLNYKLNFTLCVWSTLRRKKGTRKKATPVRRKQTPTTITGILTTNGRAANGILITWRHRPKSWEKCDHSHECSLLFTILLHFYVNTIFFSKQCHSSNKRESMHGNLKNNSVASYMLYITQDFQIAIDLIFKMTDYDGQYWRYPPVAQWQW